MRRIPAAGASVRHADEGMLKPRCGRTLPLDTSQKEQQQITQLKMKIEVQQQRGQKQQE